MIIICCCLKTFSFSVFSISLTRVFTRHEFQNPVIMPVTLSNGIPDSQRLLMGLWELKVPRRSPGLGWVRETWLAMAHPTGVPAPRTTRPLTEAFPGNRMTLSRPKGAIGKVVFVGWLPSQS